MKYIVAKDRNGVHVRRVHSMFSPYAHPNFLVEKAIYTAPHGTEYVAAVYADTPEQAKEAGLQFIRDHFPEAMEDTTP